MSDHRNTLVFVMGPTCSGKSTFLRAFKARNPDRVGLVEVGKALRQKYPPGHFKGQDNPKHVADEAWEICESQVAENAEAGKDIILVDGQPRDIPQVTKCLECFSHDQFRIEFVLLDASLEAREQRARATRQGEDLEELAIPRLRNDMISNYTVLVELMKYQWPLIVYDTDNPEEKEAIEFFSPLMDLFL